jgi:hypothetical protein
LSTQHHRLSQGHHKHAYAVTEAKAGLAFGSVTRYRLFRKRPFATFWQKMGKK